MGPILHHSAKTTHANLGDLQLSQVSVSGLSKHSSAIMPNVLAFAMLGAFLEGLDVWSWHLIVIP